MRHHSEETARMPKRVPMARHSKFRRHSPSTTLRTLELYSHGYCSLSQLSPKVKQKMQAGEVKLLV